jgi:hypothetical protein
MSIMIMSRSVQARGFFFANSRNRFSLLQSQKHPLSVCAPCAGLDNLTVSGCSRVKCGRGATKVQL